MLSIYYYEEGMDLRGPGKSRQICKLVNIELSSDVTQLQLRRMCISYPGYRARRCGRLGGGQRHTLAS